MRKKIQVSQLQVGMFIDEVVGSWLNNPFWKSAVILTDAKQLAQLKNSPIKEVWIDVHKGRDVDDEVHLVDGVEFTTSSTEAIDDPVVAQVGPAMPRPSVSLQEEVARAGRICAQAKGAMKTMFQDVRMGKAIDAEHCLPLVDDITQSVQRNPGAIVSLARLKTSDDYTYMHSVAVCALMVSLSRQLGLSAADTREAGMAGLLHDLGKSAMPTEVLNKPGKLTVAEFDIMKGHPEAGHRMLTEGQGVGPIAMDVCLHHHEKINGLGYPHGLKGDEISLFARMGAVCDVYDAITSNRPYKTGWDPAESVQKMAQWAREGHFDGAIFQAFVKSIGIYPTGSLVKLKSGRLAVVVDQGASSLLTPVLKAFYSTKAGERIAPQRLDLGAPDCTDQIVSRESPAAWGFSNLDELWMAER
ncbi:HD-GYP domain-containing protein [Aquabacterium sp.]|uniref:HD-GYP domain-containing protein n=1 Tax=Aquabacterium sp. TaxID=1872578 RepID=UPI00248996AA|nr:HD-GYP domain-containing protein [Aquabacterium sp.]MDI1261015.1 HD-GYP domain-containing protein [Aquabacterium sp.]